MTTIKAIVRNGRIETEEPLDLPEGTKLLIPLPGGSTDDEEDWDNSPEGIAAWLKWADSLEPLIFTAEEKAAWEVDDTDLTACDTPVLIDRIAEREKEQQS